MAARKTWEQILATQKQLLLQLSPERTICLCRLLKDVPTTGIVSARAETVSGMISAAFDGGALAGIQKAILAAEKCGAMNVAEEIRKLCPVACDSGANVKREKL